MRDRLFLFHLVPASKYAQAIPGKQFFPWRVSTIGAAIYFPGTSARSPHRLPQYHSDRHSMLPNEKVLCPRKITVLYMREQNRENQKHFSNLFPAPSPVYYFHNQM